MTKIIASSPHLLTFDIEQNIGPKIRQLKHLLPGRPPFSPAPSPSPSHTSFYRHMQSKKRTPKSIIHRLLSPSQDRPSRLLCLTSPPPLPVSPGANVVKIVNAAPNLLSYDIEASLGVKINKLAELLPGADIVKLIQYAPTLLYHDTANSIAPKLRCAAYTYNMLQNGRARPVHAKFHLYVMHRRCRNCPINGRPPVSHGWPMPLPLLFSHLSLPLPCLVFAGCCRSCCPRRTSSRW